MGLSREAEMRVIRGTLLRGPDPFIAIYHAATRQPSSSQSLQLPYKALNKAPKNRIDNTGI